MTDTTIVSERNAALLDWYDTSSRSLPWRTDRDPYLTLVSEAMLQQTQVERVIPKFEQFIDTWPTVTALAQASTKDLLTVWSGLGYNSRALRVREAASVIAADGWPTTIEGLQALPGVGPYTAAAIASIAFGHDVPAVDTNLKRVLSRWRGEPLSGSVLDEVAFEAIGSPAGSWNQGVMDIGATICRPRNPSCGVCPVSLWCADPDVYVPPAPQGSFKGSNRELRGALVRAGLAGEDLHTVGRSLGRSDAAIADTIASLRTENLIE